MRGKEWTIEDYKKWLMADLDLRKGSVPSFTAISPDGTPREALAFKVGFIHGLQMARQVIKLVDPRDEGEEEEKSG